MDKKEVIVDGILVPFSVGTTIINLDRAKKNYSNFEYITTSSDYFYNGELVEKPHPIHFFKSK